MKAILLSLLFAVSTGCHEHKTSLTEKRSYEIVTDGTNYAVKSWSGWISEPFSTCESAVQLRDQMVEVMTRDRSAEERREQEMRKTFTKKVECK